MNVDRSDLVIAAIETAVAAIVLWRWRRIRAGTLIPKPGYKPWHDLAFATLFAFLAAINWIQAFHIF